MAPAFSQLATPNQAGVALGHIHLSSRDPEALSNFFVLLGGTTIQKGTLQLIQFPGVFVIVTKGESSGGSDGSVVNHFGFQVKSMPETLAKIKSLNLNMTQLNPQQAMIAAPGDVLVELIQDSALTVPIQMHHVHLFLAAPLEVQAWYVKMFGATPGKRGPFDTAKIPGGELTLAKNDMPQAPTKGRSIDHIGFEVRNLEALTNNLEAQGVRLEAPIRKSPDGKTKIAFFTDPWGTRIELTEGLAASF